MKISLNWLKKYVDIDISNEELIRLIGARLVEVEGVIDESHKYDNIYIVRVDACEKIPDTHLTLCQINVGQPELVQVVCGAPNVRAGMLAAWIAPGAVVPASVHEDAPFVIGKRKMLGKYESNGMLAGADELDFGDDHSGIVEIDPESAKPGDLLADVFELNDLILEIENKSLTHRPDTFGIIGFAREVAGILGKKFEFEPRQEYAAQGSQNILTVMTDSDICPRYTAVVLEKHGETKKKYLTWQDTILSKSGMRPIDAIVDATNYLMLLTGQPLHAFDYDKFVAVGGVEKPKILVKLAKNGEKLELLDGEKILLNDNDIVITSNDKPVALAGAMGGKSTMIDESTKKIIIESATFSLYNLRKTQMAHGIFSEAITRFTKGQPAYQTLAVATACADMLADGYKIVATADAYPNPAKETVVKITTGEINTLLGTDYSKKLIVETLENVGFKVKTFGNQPLSVKAPEWRTDIHIKEDIIEEVGRLLGYDNITPTLPLHATAEKNQMFELKKGLRSYMLRLGANELLTYSFVSEKVLKKAGVKISNSYKIVNSISPELQYVRQSLVPSLLEKAYLNQKIPFDKFALYELNKVYQKEWGMNEENVPVEKTHMGFVVAERKNSQTAFYLAKKYVDTVLAKYGISVKYIPLKTNSVVAAPFEPKRAAEIRLLDDESVLIGVVGEFKNSVRHEFKLAEFLAGFEIDLDLVLSKANFKKHIEFGHKEERDLTVETVDTYAAVVEKIKKVLTRCDAAAEISPISIYRPEGSDKKHISVHLVFSKYNDGVMAELENL